MESSNPPSVSIEKSIESGQKGKILSLWSRCIAKPSSLLGSSIVRLWSQTDVKNRLASVAVKRVDIMSKCLKRLPEVSLNCKVSASFSLSSPKIQETSEDLEKQERCRKIARIEHEIQTLERHLATFTVKKPTRNVKN